MILRNEIILGRDGNLTVSGGVAHKLYFLMGADCPVLRAPNENKYFVYTGDGVLRAAQSSLANALEYMNEDRVLCYVEKTI